MKIDIQCTNCSKKFVVPDRYAGLRVLCPICKTVIRVPLAADADQPLSIAALDPPSKVKQPQLVAKPHSPPDLSSKIAAPQIVPTTQISPVFKGEPSISKGALEPKPQFSPCLSIAGIANPKLEQIPALESFLELRPSETLVSQYRIRVLRPKIPWLLFLVFVFIWPLIPIIPFIVVYHFLRRRGHTFLYLTNQRLIILELEQGSLGRSQTVLSYEVNSIAGFTLHAQRGVKKFISLFTLTEKRTFYISITTNTYDTFELGSSNALKSNYDPGLDAINLCSELDALLLGIKSGGVKSINYKRSN